MIIYRSFYTSFHYNLAYYIVNYTTPQCLKNPFQSNIDSVALLKLSSINQKKEFLLFVDKIASIAYSIFKNDINKIDFNNLNKVFYQDIYTDDQLLEILNSKVNLIKKNMLKKFSQQLKPFKTPLKATVLIKKIFNLAFQNHSSQIILYLKSNLEIFNSSNT